MDRTTGVAIIRLRSPDAKGPLQAPCVQALCVSAAEVAAAALLCLAAWTSVCHSGGMHGTLREAVGVECVARRSVIGGVCEQCVQSMPRIALDVHMNPFSPYLCNTWGLAHNIKL